MIKLRQEVLWEAGKNCSRQFFCISSLHGGQNPAPDLLLHKQINLNALNVWIPVVTGMTANVVSQSQV